MNAKRIFALVLALMMVMTSFAAVLSVSAEEDKFAPANEEKIQMYVGNQGQALGGGGKGTSFGAMVSVPDGKRLTQINFHALATYNTNENHKAIGEYLQSAVAGIGISMNLENQEWNTFLNTRKDGQFSVARNGWVADYTDPICFLDMWITASGNNDVQFGKGAHADLAIYDLDLTSYGYDVKVEDGTWAETYDVLIPLIKSCTDNTTRYALMHIAEDLLMSTGAIVPLYFYTDIYMIDDSINGFFANPLGYKYFMYCTIG